MIVQWAKKRVTRMKQMKTKRQRTSTWAKPNLKLCSLMEILCENKQYPWQIVRDGFVQFHRIFEGPPGRCEVDSFFFVNNS